MRVSSATAVAVGLIQVANDLIQVQGVLIQVETSEDLVLQKNSSVGSSAVPELLQKNSTKNCVVPQCCETARNNDLQSADTYVTAQYNAGKSPGDQIEISDYSGYYSWMTSGCNYKDDHSSTSVDYKDKHVYHYNCHANARTTTASTDTWVSVPCQKYEYKGCTSSAGWSRQHTYDVPVTAAGVETCRGLCNDNGYQYFGFECPHANGAEVHCECNNVINDNQPRHKCMEFNTRSGGHCSGPTFVVEDAFIGTYYMGAGSINSMYSVSETGR